MADQNSFQERKEAAMSEVKAVYAKHGVKTDFQIVFPQYNILPDIVKLALAVLNREGGMIQIKLQDAREGEGT